MPHVYVSFKPSAGADGQARGFVYERADGATTLRWLGNPNGEDAFDARPEMVKYRNRLYIVGIFSRPRVRDEYGIYRRAGIRPPKSQPTLVDGGGSGGSTGQAIGYQTFVQIINGKKMVESNPGPQTATLDAAGTGFVWDNIDWDPEDPHVTHARGYRSMDGSIPALAWERPLAPGSTVSENVPTGALGETLPVRRGLDGQYSLDIFARGVPPPSRFAEVYHEAVWYAGDPVHPERIYPSKLYEPEAVNTTPVTVAGRVDIPWLETTDGAPVTGIKRQGDELVVGTYRGIDVIQGYSYGDYSIRRISNYWGVISHFSMRRAGPLGSLFFASPHGVTTYNAGSFRYIMGNYQSWWRDEYRANPDLFAQCFGVENRYWELYKLLIPQSDGTSLWLCVDYNSAELGMPIWVEDRRDRKDYAAAELAIDGSTEYYELYTGSCDGKVRQEDVGSDADDDGDTYLKKFTVQTPHIFPEGDQGGHEGQGHTYNALDLFLRHETNDADITIYGGDDFAPDAASPHWQRTLKASAPASGQRARVSRTSQHETLSGVSGKGATLKVEVESPLEVEFRGWGLDYLKGPQSRSFE